VKGRAWLPGACLAASVLALSVMLFGRLSHPLLWQDEGETAMFASRVVAYGYPKVHGERNVLYEFGANVAVGIKESVDAYIGTTWGHFYFAVPGWLWAAGTDEPYARTLRMRLPFAAAGALGLAVLVAGVLPVFGGDRRRALWLAAAFAALASVSVSLLLHLREARYYPLLWLLTAAILAVHWRYAVFGRSRTGAWVLSIAALLVLVFNVFFQAWFLFAALLGGERLLHALRAPAPAGGRWRLAGVGVLPIAVSAVAVAPLVVFFETVQIAASFREDLGFGVRQVAANLGEVALHFARHEFLVAALAARAAVLVAGRAARRRGEALPLPEARRISAFLLAFSAGWAVLSCANPLVYERYFVILSPLLALSFALDGAVLLEAAPRLGPGAPRRAWGTVLAALVALAVLGAPARPADVRGRIEELVSPYRGPLDFAVEYLRAAYPEPERLVIATNYANHSLMYYLGSHVIVGLNLSNIRRDRELSPDVVIPRRRWPRGLAELDRFLAAGRFRAVRLPVRDLHFNNVPALSRSRSVPDPHRFRTAHEEDPERQLVLFVREPGAVSPSGPPPPAGAAGAASRAAGPP